MHNKQQEKNKGYGQVFGGKFGRRKEICILNLEMVIKRLIIKGHIHLICGKKNQNKKEKI